MDIDLSAYDVADDFEQEEDFSLPPDPVDSTIMVDLFQYDVVDEAELPDMTPDWIRQPYQPTEQPDVTLTAPEEILIPEAGPMTGEPTVPTVEGPREDVIGRAADIGLDSVRAFVGYGQAWAGALQMTDPSRPFMDKGLVKQGLDAIGYDPVYTDEFLKSMYSAERATEEQKLNAAQGVVDTVKVLGTEPALILGRFIESAPHMLSAMGVAKAVGLAKFNSTLASLTKKGVPLLEATKLANKAQSFWATIAASATEGMSNAATFDDLIRKNVDIKKAYLATIGQIASTATIGLAGGSLGKKIGLGDADTMMKEAGNSLWKFVKGAVQESFFEEAPQSYVEQMWNNFAEDRPLTEGAAKAAAIGAVTAIPAGGAMSLAGGKPSELPREDLLAAIIKNPADTDKIIQSASPEDQAWIAQQFEPVSTENPTGEQKLKDSALRMVLPKITEMTMAPPAKEEVPAEDVAAGFDKDGYAITQDYGSAIAPEGKPIYAMMPTVELDDNGFAKEQIPQTEPIPAAEAPPVAAETITIPAPITIQEPIKEEIRNDVERGVEQLPEGEGDGGESAGSQGKEEKEEGGRRFGKVLLREQVAFPPPGEYDSPEVTKNIESITEEDDLISRVETMEMAHEIAKQEGDSRAPLIAEDIKAAKENIKAIADSAIAMSIDAEKRTPQLLTDERLRKIEERRAKIPSDQSRRGDFDRWYEKSELAQSLGVSYDGLVANGEHQFTLTKGLLAGTTRNLKVDKAGEIDDKKFRELVNEIAYKFSPEIEYFDSIGRVYSRIEEFAYSPEFYVKLEEVLNGQPEIDADNQKEVRPARERDTGTNIDGDKQLPAGTGRVEVGSARSVSEREVESVAPTTEKKLSQKEPWELTKAEWNAERERLRPNIVQSMPTKGSGSQAASKIRGLERLTFGVADEASQKLASAAKGEITLTPDEVSDLQDIVDTPVSHRAVIAKALEEGKKVPASIIAEYPDLTTKYSKGQPTGKSTVPALTASIDKIVTPKGRENLKVKVLQTVDDLAGKLGIDAKFMTSRPNEIEQKAFYKFGRTYLVDKAGYISKDGKYIDFSGGEDERTINHDEIAVIFPDDFNGNPVEFFVENTGAARIHATQDEINIDAFFLSPEQAAEIARDLEERSLTIDYFDKDRSPASWTGKGLRAKQKLHEIAKISLKIKYAKDGSIQGAFDPRTGDIYLVADNVSTDQAWPILLHESIHQAKSEEVSRATEALKDQLDSGEISAREFSELKKEINGWSAIFDKRTDGIMESIDAKLKLNNPAWKAAEKKAIDALTQERIEDILETEKGVSEEEAQARAEEELRNDNHSLLREETIAYFMSANSNRNQSLWQRIANAIRAWAVKIGIKRTITDRDIQAIAEDAIQRRARRTEATARQVSGELAPAFGREQFAPTFYSQLLQTVTDKLPGKGTPESYKQAIDSWVKKGEIKQEEVDWSGINEFLDAAEGKLTKEAVAEFLSANNVRVEEVEKKKTSTKFESYQLAGGENYRELLLTLPPKPLTKEEFSNEAARGGVIYGSAARLDEAYQDYLKDPGTDFSRQANYRSSHFDEPNILAHIRFNERTDADGNKVLFLEELQIDWHQTGRKKGYGIAETYIPHVYTPEEFEVSETDSQWVTTDINGVRRVVGKGTVSGEDDAREYFARWLTRLDKEYAVEQSMRSSGKVPDAPFKKTWPLLAMKRMVRYAAENGFDKIAWTTGEQQADRYDLSVQLSEITISPAEEQGAVDLVAIDKEGRKVLNQKNILWENVPDYIGKDLAEKAMEDGAENKSVVYSGPNLKVGGEGMKGFYDRILPSITNKFFKKFGGKVGETDILAPVPGFPTFTKNRSLKVPSLTITDEMRRVSTEQGLPLFAKSIATDPRIMFSKETPTTENDILRAEVGLQNVYDRNRSFVGKSTSEKAVSEAKKIIKETQLGIDKYLGVISTRLANVNLELKYNLLKYEQIVRLRERDDLKNVEGFLQKLKKIPKADKKDLDLARKNSDQNKIDQLMAKHGMEAEHALLRDVLDRLHRRAKIVGYDVGFIENFHPRVLFDHKGYLEYMYGADDWPAISMAIEQKQIELGRYMTVQEKAEFVNLFLRGYGTNLITLAKPGTLKQREIEFITPEINQFYMDSDAALINYISKTNAAIETRRFFGKGVNRNGSTAPSLPFGDIGQQPETFDYTKNQDSELMSITEIEDTIGYYVADLILRKKIAPGDEQIVADILRARFNERGTRGVIGLYKNLSYIDTMGSIASAITQVGDLAWSLYKNGIITTAVTGGKALAGKSTVTKEDLGIERIAQEFQEQSKAAKAVGFIFKAVGLERMDSLGKEVLINASLDTFQKKARKNPDKLIKELSPAYREEARQLVEDLRSGKITEPVKFLLFCTLCDFQPITQSQMTQKYLEGGNGRIFYMLKTFTIEQFDIYRREVYQQIAKPETRVQGIKNLIKLSAAFVAANATADLLKALLLFRPVEPDDLVVDNLLRLFGISKFVAWKAREEGVGKAALMQIMPPAKFLDALTKDIATAGDEKGLETAASIPVFGKLYYWWFGKGTTKKSGRGIMKTISDKEISPIRMKPKTRASFSGNKVKFRKRPTIKR